MWFRKPTNPQSKVIESTLNLAYPVSVRRSSKRRSIELRVSGGGGLRVLCPIAMTDFQIGAFIDSKSSWIESKLSQIASRQLESPPSLEDGSLWRFRGQEFTLKLETGDARVLLEGDFLTVYSDLTAAERLLRDWYYRQAESYLLSRTAHFSERMNVEPAKVQLKAYRSMWGRCNARHEIAFDWRVIQAPDSVIDYLVVHELAHLHHFNHSPEFWQCVESQLPRFRDSKLWLREHARLVKGVFAAR